jgi:ribosome recycling factor
MAVETTAALLGRYGYSSRNAGSMQVDVTKDAEGKIQKVGDKLKKEIKVVVSKKLTSIANSGNATEQDMAAAAATLANKAAKQLGAEAQVEAKKIKAGVNQKLAQDQKEVQDKNKLEKQLLSDYSGAD